jgi:hypothetical protein
MPSAGDIDMTHDFFLLPSSKNATAAINKGDIVTLQAGRRFAIGDKGPYGVANQAIASGADMKGKVVIDGVVYVAAVGAIAQFAGVMPANGTQVSGTTGIGDTKLVGFRMGEYGLAFDAAVNTGDLIRVNL